MDKSQSTQPKDPFWVPLPCVPEQNAFHSSIVYKDYIITISGWSNDDFAGCEVLNMQTYGWVPVRYIGKGKIPLLYGQNALLLNENTIIIFGRNVKKPNETTNIILITIQDSSDFAIEVNKLATKGASFPLSCGTAGIYQGKLYVFGGSDKTRKTSNQVWKLDLESLEWACCKTSGNPPCQRSFQSGILVNQEMYIFGGRDQDEKYLNDLYVLNLNTMVWQRGTDCESAPIPREGACMIEHSGKIYLVGGQKGDEFFCGLFEFDISTRKWTKVKTIHHLEARSYASSVWYKDSLIVWGGYDGDAEEYYADIQQIKLVESKTESEDLEYRSEMKEILLNPQYSDICFKVQDQEFPAHKAILSARCKYLKNMFESGMKESHTDKIIITDVEPLSFKVLLEFLYSNNVELTDKIALDLLKLADKWSLLNLKNKCEVFLAKSLSIDNFKDYVAVTKLTDSTLLTNAITDFAIKNFKALKAANSLSGLSQTMFLEIIEKVVEK